MPVSPRRPSVPDPMLIVDRRTALAGAPGLHVVLIGISDYTYLTDPEDPPGEGLLALRKLRSSAMTVMALARKLQEFDADKRLVRPLATIRLLVAPSPEEIAADPALAASDLVAPTFENIELAMIDWRDDVATLAENQAMFFFSGHGLRRSLEESILLAQDFNRPKFATMKYSFELRNIRNGMMPTKTFTDIGREQFYFVDACRDKLDALDGIDPITPTAIFTADVNALEDRKAPIFFATTVGGKAAGEPGKPTYFGNALIWALENGSVEKERLPGIKGGVWPVYPSSLKLGIEAFDKLFDARVELTGFVSDPVLCFNRNAPKLHLKVALEPLAMTSQVERLTITEINTKTRTELVPAADADHSCVDITAGLYKFKVKAKPKAAGLKSMTSEATTFSVKTKMPWTFELIIP